MKAAAKTAKTSQQCGLEVSVYGQGAPMRVMPKQFPAGTIGEPQKIYRGTLGGTRLKFFGPEALVLVAYDGWVHRYSLDGLNGNWIGRPDTSQLDLPTGKGTDIEAVVQTGTPAQFAVLHRNQAARHFHLYNGLPLDPEVLGAFEAPGMPLVFGMRYDNAPEIAFGGVANVHVWDFSARGVSQSFATDTNKDGKAPNRVESVAISSRYVASVSNHHVVRVWDRTTSKMVMLSEVKYCGEVLLDEEGQLFLGMGGGDVEVWDIAGGTRLHVIANRRGEQASLARLTLSPNGKRLAVQNAHERVDIYDTESFTLVASLPHTQYRSLVQFSTDAKWVTTAIKGGEIAIWRIQR